MTVPRLYLTIISSLTCCMAYATYDGRLADDPYHKSPTWLYIIVLGAIIYGIIRGLNASISKRIPKKKTNPESKPIQREYVEYGSSWDECPSCKGTGWVDGKEISYLLAPPETVCCDQCKGYRHQLTPEAELLHAEYCKQYDEEQIEERNLRIQKEKERAEIKKKLSEERWQRKQNAIAEIKSGGRRVLKEDEYLNELEELRTNRKELVKKVMTMLETEPLCTSCQNEKPKQDCPVCRGTGHIPTKEANKQIDILLELFAKTKQLWHDYNALYPHDIDSEFHFSSIGFLINQFSGTTQNINPPKSTLIRDRIVKLLENEPYCRHCMATGHLKVRLDYSTQKAYEQVPCQRCKGRGRLYYNN